MPASVSVPIEIGTTKGPSISVIIPTYNCERYVCRAINSILKQGIVEIQIIIVDDASTDRTVDTIAKKYGTLPNVHIEVQEKNQRQGAARNKGLDIATGKYVFFLDADDWIDDG